MYVDLIIFILLVIFIIAYFRDFMYVVYLVVSMDMLYRLLHFIANNVDVEELTVLIYKYIPSSVPNLISKYVGDNIFSTIFLWVVFGLYCIFLGHTIRRMVRKKV